GDQGRHGVRARDVLPRQGRLLGRPHRGGSGRDRGRLPRDHAVPGGGAAGRERVLSKDADRIILDFREKGRRGRSPFSSRAGLGRDRGRNGPTPLFLSAPKYLNNKATSSGCNYDEIGGPRARAAGGAR